MRHTKLDKIDRKILQIIQEKGRITNVELARNAGISAPPCLRRVRALEEAGYIKGYNAKIDPILMGYGVTVFAHVKLASQKEQDLKAFEKKCKEWPVVRECYMLAGDIDYLLKIVARDWDDYQNFLSNELATTPGINSIKSALAMRPVKNAPGIPIDV